MNAFISGMRDKASLICCFQSQILIGMTPETQRWAHTTAKFPDHPALPDNNIAKINN
jgi:hypothetical protein